MELHSHQTQPAHMPPVFAPPNFSPNPVSKLYDRDIYAWATESARLLQERRFDELDLTNLIDEVQDMAKSEQRSIFNHLVNLLMHLLKWEYQPAIQSKSWQMSIVNARLAIRRLVRESPSLHAAPERDLQEAYEDAKRFASQETGLASKAFPVECSFTIAQVLDEDWLPA